MVEKLSVKQKPILRGEAALAVAVIVNTFGVVLMLYSESGISAISSVPYAFSLVFPVCIFFGASSAYAWHMDISVPRGSGSQPDAYAKAICTTVFI